MTAKPLSKSSSRRRNRAITKGRAATGAPFRHTGPLGGTGHGHACRGDFRTKLQNWLPKLVLSPSVALIFVFVYGFILFTVYVSFTDSRILPFVDKNGQPTYELIGFATTRKLFKLSHWEIAVGNMAGLCRALYHHLHGLIGTVARDPSRSENPGRRVHCARSSSTPWRSASS